MTLVLRSQAATLIGRVPYPMKPRRCPVSEAIAEAWHAAGLASQTPESASRPSSCVHDRCTVRGGRRRHRPAGGGRALSRGAGERRSGTRCLPRSTARSRTIFPPNLLVARVHCRLRPICQLRHASQRHVARTAAGSRLAVGRRNRRRHPLESGADSPSGEMPAETPEQSTLAAREAGLVAARELSDTPAFNRWAAGTLG